MTNLPTIGFIGLGEMGGPMAVNLLRAGYPLAGYDPDAGRLAAVVDAGGEAGADACDVVQRCDVIATSLPSSGAWVEVAERDILPNVRAGQFLIDFGTVTPPEHAAWPLLCRAGRGGARRARQRRRRGAASAAYMFAGGDRRLRTLPAHPADRRRPDRITYCGPRATVRRSRASTS